MKKNRLPIIFLILLTVLSPLGAVTIDEIIEGAKNNSPSYQNVSLTYQNGLLSVEALEEKDKVIVSVDADVNPLVNSGTDAVGISVSPGVSVTLPNDGNTTITGDATLSTEYKTGSTTVSGDVGVSHTFDFSSYDSDYADDIEYTITKYNTEKTKSESELSFEKSVLSTVSQILSLESSLLQSEFNVEKQQKALDKIIALGTYSETSATYINTENVLTSYKESLEALQKQYDNLLAYYTTLTGLEWNGVEVGDAPTLELKTVSDGNTSVKIQSLSYESSYENYKRVLAESNKSSLSTSLGVGASSTKNYTVSGSVKYTDNNWNVSVTPAINITSTGKTTPTVTISGHWSNETTSGAREVNSALNSAKMAENSYLEALSTYNQNVSSYSLQILEYNNKKAQKEAELEYEKKLLENEQTLYDIGLSTSDSLKSAQINYSVVQNEWKMLVIEGLSLQCDLDIFAL